MIDARLGVLIGTVPLVLDVQTGGAYSNKDLPIALLVVMKVSLSLLQDLPNKTFNIWLRFFILLVIFSVCWQNLNMNWIVYQLYWDSWGGWWAYFWAPMTWRGLERILQYKVKNVYMQRMKLPSRSLILCPDVSMEQSSAFDIRVVSCSGGRM